MSPEDTTPFYVKKTTFSQCNQRNLIKDNPRVLQDANKAAFRLHTGDIQYW